MRRRQARGKPLPSLSDQQAPGTSTTASYHQQLYKRSSRIAPTKTQRSGSKTNAYYDFLNDLAELSNDKTTSIAAPQATASREKAPVQCTSYQTEVTKGLPSAVTFLARSSKGKGLSSHRFIKYMWSRKSFKHPRIYQLFNKSFKKYYVLFVLNANATTYKC